MVSFDYLRETKLGKGKFVDRFIENFDWFIFRKGETNFFVLPVWALVKGDLTREREKARICNGRGYISSKTIPAENWIIPSYERQDLTAVPLFPLSICDVPFKAEGNGYVQNFKFVKEIEKYGYKSCGLCRGKVMEQKHPVIEDYGEKLGLNPDMLEEEAAWLLADEYAKKIEEQYRKFMEERRSGKAVYIDAYGLPY